ncbi:DUF3761 domain-containing protein [Streptomyces sp. NPDC020096]
MSRTSTLSEGAPRHGAIATVVPGGARYGARKFKRAAAAVLVATALLVPAGEAQAATSRPAARCAHHTTGVCAPWVRHPRGATAQCKDGTFSYSAHFSGTCSHHRGVRYWFK